MAAAAIGALTIGYVVHSTVSSDFPKGGTIFVNDPPPVEKNLYITSDGFVNGAIQTSIHLKTPKGGNVLTDPVVTHTGWIETMDIFQNEKGGNFLMDEKNSNYGWGNPKTLRGHFNDHGGDFGAKDKSDYANKANDFYKNKDQYATKTDKNGEVRIYDKGTNTFGAYNADGTTKSFFKPDPSIHGMKNNTEYWNSQPGN